MELDPGNGPTPNRLLVVDNRTCNVYSIPSAALKVACASPVVINMDELQSLVETQQFSIGAVLKHVRSTGPNAFTDDHVGVVAHGTNNVWVSRIRTTVPVAHPVVAACLRHETAEIQEEFRKHPPDRIYIGEELHWIWSCNGWRAATAEELQRLARQWPWVMDAFPIRMEADNHHGALDVSSIPDAVLIPHSALPVSIRMFLLTAAEPQPGAKARETNATRRSLAAAALLSMRLSVSSRHDGVALGPPDEHDQHRKRGLATAWPVCDDPSDSKRQRKEASWWLPEELWGRIFAMATADAMHEESSERATRHLRALSLTNKLGRSVVCSVVAAGVRAAATALVVCDQLRGEDAFAMLDAAARAATRPVQTTASATYAGVLFRNIGLPIDAVYFLLREDPASRCPRAIQMLRDRDDEKALVWYLQWRKAKLAVYNGRMTPRAVRYDADTLCHRRLRWRGIEPADEEPDPKGMARADAAPRNVRNDFLETVLTPFGVA